jgi:hypothetical protein
VRRRQFLLAVLVAWGALAPGRVVGQARVAAVRRIATDTLRDVAITRIDGGQATIYYNPVLLERLGPQLGDFVLAHEEGHVHFGHAGGALLTSQPDFAQVRQQQELEADCWAAGELSATNPDALRAAIRFFTELGPVRFDRVHPTGEQRAARILACLPEDSAPAPAESVEPPPDDVPAGPITVLVRAVPRLPVDYRAVGEISVDGALVGRLSSAELAESLTLRLVDPGAHRERVRLQLLSLEGMMQFTPAGTVVSEGTLSLRNGDVLSARWAPGGAVGLVVERRAATRVDNAPGDR